MTTATSTFPGETKTINVVEPRHQLLLKKCMASERRSQFVGLLKRREKTEGDVVGETEWKAEEVGCLASIEAVDVLDDKSEKSDDGLVLRSKVTLKGVGRFQVQSHFRQPLGFWVVEANEIHGTLVLYGGMCA